MGRSCEDEVVQQLQDLRQRAADYARRDGRIAQDEYFFAEQNARLVKNAEQYYRTMFQGRVSSWNLRDQHMAETIGALVQYLDRFAPTKCVIWAHNSHLGDARATEMGWGGELNVGFDAGDAEVEGGLEADERALRLQAARPTMALDFEHG